MHRDGHVGMNLLLYAPVAFGLAWVGMVTPLAWGLLGTVLLSTLPDVDLYTSWLTHRGVTHTALFALLVGALLGGAGALAASQGLGTSVGLSTVELADTRATVAGGGFGFFVGAFAVVGHLAGDAFTPMGVAPWEPFSGRRHSLGWFDADSDVANRLWLGTGIVLFLLAVLVGTLLRTGVLVVGSTPF